MTRNITYYVLVYRNCTTESWSCNKKYFILFSHWLQLYFEHIYKDCPVGEYVHSVTVKPFIFARLSYFEIHKCSQIHKIICQQKYMALFKTYICFFDAFKILSFLRKLWPFKVVFSNFIYICPKIWGMAKPAKN